MRKTRFVFTTIAALCGATGAALAQEVAAETEKDPALIVEVVEADTADKAELTPEEIAVIEAKLAEADTVQEQPASR